MTKKSLKTNQKLVLSAIFMATYIAVLFLSQAISFGAYQMRLATAIYGLTYLYPFLALPLSLANALANSFGGLGIIDIIGGFFAGILTTGAICLIKKLRLNVWMVALAIFLIPSFIAPLWLSTLLQVPYWALVINLLVGQSVPGIIAVLLVKALEKRGFHL
ncbi:QueT transporter family protein [Streptococcus loxodontisalivarius]|uniref:Membrane protein n=1 Tax=Streptococcus loxodontisalivarius TaxID=1349415 RepID=A0ABS2PTX6_9STRE|nr:QueT transporter family protein [Streptococcus loxodontisalivarius]MBM7642990.1 putative membrane protein [Streptococcus loxodontisalivarius]